jgi:3-hydroxybutyryl-CoA dehydrogenase
MKRIVVVGTGTMGTGVTRLLSDNNLEVVNLRARDLVNADEPNFNVIKKAELVIEATRENFTIKTDLLKRISKINEDGLIGTTTSSLSIASLATSVADSSRFCGIHFMNPAHKIPVIEFTPSEGFLPRRRIQVIEFLKSIDRVVFETLDQPGFILNALLFPLLNRAVYILESSRLSPREIDQMIVQVCGHKLGPLATLDLIGLDVCLEIIEILHERDPIFNLPPASKLIELVRDKKLGKKTGFGFYDY